jgi:hypothetical protein
MALARRNKRPIPSIGSRETTFELNDYSLGYNSFYSNDKMRVKNGGTNIWRLAQDARITTLGEYTSRKGVDFHSAAVGETQDDAQEATTSAADQSFNQTARIAQVFTSTVSQRLTKLEINIKNDATATGTPMVELWSNISGAPGAMLGRSSIASSTLTSSYQYLTARFFNAPEIEASTDYWIVVYTQSVASGSYKASSTTAGTSALTSTDSGTTWSAASFDINFKQHYATKGVVKGFIRAYKSDGTKVSIFAHGTSLFTVNNTTGALTAIKTGLSASATEYSFALVNDVVYYVNGYDGYRKWDFTTESQINTTDYSHITQHKGLMFLLEKDDPNKLAYSNFADYETFTSTDFVYVPSPKTGDPVVGIKALNGFLFLKTLNNGFILSGSDNATFSLDEAPDQKGTFTQNTIDSDKNFVYFLSNDGVYYTNGSEPQLLSSDIYNDIANLPNKDMACLRVNRGRVYLWYTPSGEATNSKCFVFSLNFGDSGGTTESTDTDSFVARAFNGFRDSDQLLVASSRVGQIYWQENDSNDDTNLGGDINFLLQTHYMVGPSPAVLKEVRFWQPRFAAQSGNYSIDAQYAVDLRNNWITYASPNVQGAGVIYGSGVTYGGGAVYGATAETQAHLYIPGEYRRTAIRYKHYATRQPNAFLGHTFVMQQRRLR